MSIFQDAESIVNGPRQENYDHPLDNFTRISKMWSVILGIEVPWWKVALCMDATKISREIHRPQYENRVDGIGYWGALQLGYEEQERRSAQEYEEKWVQLELPFDE